MLYFPSRTKNSYVTVIPEEYKPLKEFTACLQANTTMDGSLFSFTSRKYDNEILLFILPGVIYKVFVGNKLSKFPVPVLPKGWIHYCISWQSYSGKVQVWMNGKRLSYSILNKGYVIPQNPSIILGQEQDSFGGGFDTRQSFVGEIADVHMWDRELSSTEIKFVFEGDSSIKGNIINWDKVKYNLYGNVLIKPLETVTLPVKC
ncbi:mucosal pentraxin-like [Protopterus annectens]|uniref:mucosal pentraxin-like n=1 Tax=Protopterus annectens TaxID=7888 RepID=UPI001CFBE4AF|nr:mucosal pentraxin-like [Protopterus annectens]